MTSRPVIHVVDDDYAVRDTLRLFLASEGYEVQAHESARDFMAAIGKGGGDCVVADIRMPEMSGVELLTKMRELQIDLPVIVITAHADVPIAVQAMKEGAFDVLMKPFDGDALLACMSRALMRSDQVHARISEIQSIRAKFATLTPRERDVLSGLLKGKPNKIIAYELNVSVRTIEVHRAGLMGKMQVKSLSELVRMSLVASLGTSADPTN